MNPFARLTEEHVQIRRVIDAMNALLDERHGDRPLPPAPFLALQRFIQRYADGAHHLKEERVLFTALVAFGPDPTREALSALDHDHEQGRRYGEVIGAAARACAAGDRRHEVDLIAATRAWCTQTAAHLEREDRSLFPLARRRLPHDVLRALPRRFALVDPLSPGDFTDAASAVVDAASVAAGHRTVG
jgi:hemerythrin-like domain-containing protein